MRRGEGAAGAAVRIVITIVAPSTALAFAGLLFWPLAVGASIIAAAWQGFGAGPALVSRLRADWASLSLVMKAALLTLGIAAALRAGTAVSTPPTDGDSLLYHLPIVAALVQDHTMWFTRALVYPAASELGDAVAAATTGNVSGMAAFQCVQIVAFMLVAFAWARRLGASLDGAVAGAVMASGILLVTDQLFTAQNDIFVCALLAAGCVLWRTAPRLSALAFGLAIAAKVTALILVPALAVVLVIVEGWTLSASDVAWGASLAAPWYLRTWVLTGGPIYTVASMGWRSTLAANVKVAVPLMLGALRARGGIGVIAGIAASIFLSLRRGRSSFERAQMWLALAALAVWLILPNAAESVLGTLDQIRNGWSLRYVLLLPFITVIALPVALERLRLLPVATLVALAAAASALVRSANTTAGDQPHGFVYALALLLALCTAASALAWKRDTTIRPRAVAVSLALALAISSIALVAGARLMAELWSSSYVQWARLIPPSDVVVDPLVRRSDKVAVFGLRSFPFVGPNFATRTYEKLLPKGPHDWLARLRRAGVPLLVASGPTGSPDEPGFLRPLAIEVQISRSPGVCLLATRGYARVYGLEPAICTSRRVR